MDLSNTKIIVGLDDTDNLESRGTGHLARAIANELASQYRIEGVTRHQLLIDSRIPSTKNNSSAAISLFVDHTSCVVDIFEWVKSMMLADFQAQSDPGLSVATVEKASSAISFGRRSQQVLVTQEEAYSLAKSNFMCIEGLGGTRDGVIGALAAVGLAASGEDGRFIQLGSLRKLEGLQPISVLLEAGIKQVCTLDGYPVQKGLVLSDKLRPACRSGKPILFVERENDWWRPIKLG